MYGAEDEAEQYSGGEQRALDPASMLAAVEQEVDERTLRLALGVGTQELDWIRAGREPDADTAARLRLLHELGAKADLSDPEAVLAAVLGEAADARPLGALRVLVRGPYRRALIAFLAVDTLLVVAIVAYALLVLR